MRRHRIKPLPVIIVLLLVGLGALYYFVIIPNRASINEFFREKEITYWENTTWAIYNSPYRFDQHIIVESGVQLTVEPGVEVFFGPNASITVYGQVQIRGLEDLPVTLAGEKPEAGYWGGLVLTSYCGMENAYERANPVFEHCVIRDAKQAIRTEGCPLDITNCWFENNEKGIEINQTANISVKNNHFLNCSESIRVHQQVPLSNMDIPEILSNEFENCRSLLLEGTVNFGYNYIHNSGSQYGAVTIAPPDSHRVTFHHNKLKDNKRALDITALQNASVELSKNCFSDNDIHLYLECNNASQADLRIMENNFLEANQFKIKALEGCTESELEKVDISRNYWGTSDKNSILESFWNYSSASSVKMESYRFIPYPCLWEERSARSEDAKLSVEPTEVKEKTLEENLNEINEELKRKLDSIRRGFNTTGNIEGPSISTNSITINGIEMDSFFKDINSRLAEGKSIKITVDEKGKIITTESGNPPPDKPALPEGTANLKNLCKIPDFPVDDLIITNEKFTDRDTAQKEDHIFLCKGASYFSHFTSNKSRVIYVSNGAKAYILNNSTGNIIFVEPAGRFFLYPKSKGNIVFYHPDAILLGYTKKPESNTTLIECPDLIFSELLSSYDLCK